MKKINFAMQTDEMLKKYLTYYCLQIPQDEKGTFLRGDAVQRLLAYQDMLANEEDRRIKVIFHRTGDETAGDYVLLVLNGTPYQFPYDQEVVLPESVVKIADHAVITKYKQAGGSATGNVAYNSFEHRMYPYTIIEYMDEEGKMVLPEDKESTTKENKKK